MNAPAGSNIEIPTLPGTLFVGGIYLARFFVGETAYALIAATKAEGERAEFAWTKRPNNVGAALSYYDGLTNTNAMVEAGSELAKWARDLRIGGHDDWYLPSRGEALLAKSVELPAGEAFDRDVYWTSTQLAVDRAYAWAQSFLNGYQLDWPKGGKHRARAVRRVPINPKLRARDPRYADTLPYHADRLRADTGKGGEGKT